MAVTDGATIGGEAKTTSVDDFMGGSNSHWCIQKWLVYNVYEGKSYLEMDDLEDVPSGKLTVCHWKWPLKLLDLPMFIYPFMSFN